MRDIIFIGLIWATWGWLSLNATATSQRVIQEADPDLAQPKSNPEIIELFDGKSLTGFEAEPEYWSVVEGVIVGQIPPGKTLDHNTWLIYKERTFADFDLRFEFQMSGLPAANSGVQFRSQAKGPRRVDGYQADLDMGPTWLGRIYDEHGRALLVERGTRVEIDAAGKREVQVFAPANQYAVLFREGEWNEYRIVAVGQRVAIWINGTLFCELLDRQEGEFDVEGSLAWQLHSGPETLLKFRKLQLEILAGDDDRLGPWRLKEKAQEPAPDKAADPGVVPKDDSGQTLNLGFESGTLDHWQATGNAFDGQPVAKDGISQRWPDQQSNKVGDYFIGGFEVVRDPGTGTLTSDWFPVSHPFASFLIGGGQNPSTRAEVQVRSLEKKGDAKIHFTATGGNQEAMRRVVVDLQELQGQSIRIRLVDENDGGWGHLNFDDFRFHADRLLIESQTTDWRSTANPILQHLVLNPRQAVTHDERALKTIQQMYVSEGFSVDVVAAEPRLHQPMAFTFDHRGRIWVVEGHCYPERRAEGQGLDRILIFADEDGDGHFETRTVFCEKLNLVSALEVGHGGVWVGAAPQLLFIPDADCDDRPDGPPVVLLDGFGYADTHETLNNFCWGPDGWLYGNQGIFNQSQIGAPGSADEDRVELAAGVFRYHPVQKKFEVFAHGGSNQWGLDFDQHGQCFMTHCRSYWGGGATTHVMPGGHYWNQVNSGYADFISPHAIDVQPALKNYLLASARYGHGEGGAGKPGSNAVYGGHSHVGTMIYLGDNWPTQYRNRLFTHNLHGHQINQQVNLREQGGFNTIHAGQDVMFCADQQYIGVELKYGPDGAVYISDWYDPRHCHSPNVEQWDRGNGRLYRLQYDPSYKPVKVDLSAASDLELVQRQHHANEWYLRMARLELASRARTRPIDSNAVEQLQQELAKAESALIRLRSLWCLNVIGQLHEAVCVKTLADECEYVRAWGIRLAVDGADSQSAAWTNRFRESLLAIASQDASGLVKRELASAAQRLPSDLAWQLIETLALQPEIEADPSLVRLLWYATAQQMRGEVGPALKLSERTPLDSFRDLIWWYAAKSSNEGRVYLIERFAQAAEPEQYRILRILEHGLEGLRGLPLPESWSQVSASLYDSADPNWRRSALSIGAVFRDGELFRRSRAVLRDPAHSKESLRAALVSLSHDVSGNNLSELLALLDQVDLIRLVVPLLRRYDDLSIAQQLLLRLPQWDAGNQALALELLSSRVSWANALLDALDGKQIPEQVLTAYYVHQMVDLGDPVLSQRLEASWGKASSSSKELQAQIAKLTQVYETAPLWAYDAAAGKQHFQQLCATCHQEVNQNSAIAPSLAGSGAKGIAYLVENVIDPNAVIGRDFQARLILTLEGRVITGLVTQETATAVTIRTATDTETIPRDEIEEIKVSDKSFMPEGLLQTLEERQVVELFKYLMSL